MLSALIHSVHSYPAMPLAEQLVHQRYVHPGPLVLRTGLLKFPTPATDRDRTVSRRSKSDFRPCSTCMSCNQALFCLYTLRTISDRTERTFERLRYSLGGDRPSQTAHLTVSQDLIQGLWLGSQYYKGGIPRVTPHRLASMLQSLPPILYM